MNKRQLGQENEYLALKYLTDKGYKIIKRNYSCKLGEIDLIAKKNNRIIFIEVKYRSNSRYGNSIEAVNKRKQQVIRQVARYYLLTNYHSLEIPISFDVIGIDKDKITHIENGF